VVIVSPKDVPAVEKHVSPLYPIGIVEEGSKGLRFA
jgi:hypothetical protein